MGASWQDPLDRIATDLERDLHQSLFRRDRSALRATRRYRGLPLNINEGLPPQIPSDWRDGSPTKETVHG